MFHTVWGNDVTMNQEKLPCFTLFEVMMSPGGVAMLHVSWDYDVTRRSGHASNALRWWCHHVYNLVSHGLRWWCHHEEWPCLTRFEMMISAGGLTMLNMGWDDDVNISVTMFQMDCDDDVTMRINMFHMGWDEDVTMRSGHVSRGLRWSCHHESNHVSHGLRWYHQELWPCVKNYWLIDKRGARLN